MAFLDRFVSDVKINLQTKLLEELPLFLQQKFHKIAFFLLIHYGQKKVFSKKLNQ